MLRVEGWGCRGYKWLKGLDEAYNETRGTAFLKANDSRDASDQPRTLNSQLEARWPVVLVQREIVRWVLTDHTRHFSMQQHLHRVAHSLSETRSVHKL